MRRSAEKLRVVPGEGSGKGARAVSLFNPDGTPYSPGGGSSFEHFTEVTEEQWLTADWPLTLQDPAAPNWQTFIGTDGRVSSVVNADDDQTFSVGRTGESWPRLQSYGDGSLHWGNGTDAPDISMKRGPASALEIEAPSGVLTTSPNGGFIAMDVRESATMSAYLNVNEWGKGAALNLFAQSDVVFDDPWKNTILLAHQDDANPRFGITAEGDISWGDGTAAPDVSLFRRPAGGLGIADSDLDGVIISDDGTGAGEQAYIDKSSFSLGGVGTGTDTTFFRASPGIWGVAGNGGGFRLTSPDGSQTKILRLSNAGTIELV